MRLDKFVILSFATFLAFMGQNISYGFDENKKEQCIKGQRRDQRSISTGDLQKVIDAQFSPEGATTHLFDHLNNIIFETKKGFQIPHYLSVHVYT